MLFTRNFLEIIDLGHLGKCRGIAVCHADMVYRGASPTAAGPQTGMGLPNWLRRRKFWSSEIPVFRIFDKIAENKFSKRVFEESFCRKCTWRAYATFHQRISCHLSRGPVFFLETIFFLLILSADFEPGAQCLPLGGLWLPGSALKGRLLSLGFHFVL